jgi:S-adenosylmethionine hydrolase
LLDSIVQFETLQPRLMDDGRIAATIIHIDRFGNCVTNITVEHLGGGGPDANLKLIVNDTLISSVRNFFAEKSGDEGELFTYLGSAGFLEIAARNASAAAILNVRIGQPLTLSAGSAGRQIASS